MCPLHFSRGTAGPLTGAIIDRLPGRNFAVQISPLTARSNELQDGVEDVSLAIVLPALDR